MTSDADREKSLASSALSSWYKWSKLEQQKRDKGKILWYLNPPVTTTETASVTTAPLTTTVPLTTTTPLTTSTAKIDSNLKETSDPANLTVAPTYQLRSTAVYSPPHGDRILPGRNELINADTSNFKYYDPNNKPKQTVKSCCNLFLYQFINLKIKNIFI